jgi:SAM-dependent methyltransferase
LSAIVTGAEYVAALEARPSDRESRRAFQALALSLAGPAATIFDFGCGPGIDARCYAERGLRVGAYDVDRDMCAYFRIHCAAGLRNGEIVLLKDGYEDFLSAQPDSFAGEVDLVTANFAPFNLAPDPRALFARLARLLVPGGRVLASVLNPLHAGDWHRGWWWSNLPRLLWRGQYEVPGAQVPITRYTPYRLLALAGSRFILEAAYADHADGAGVPARLPRSGFALNSRYLFLQFRIVQGHE